MKLCFYYYDILKIISETFYEIYYPYLYKNERYL